MYGETLGPLIGDRGYVTPAGLGQYEWDFEGGPITIADIGQSRLDAEAAGEELAPLSSFSEFTQDLLSMAREAAQEAQTAAIADAQAAAEGRVQPSELEPTVDIEIGSEIVTGVPIGQAEGIAILEESAPAFGGLAEQIAESRSGDFVASIGLPRASAPWLIGALTIGAIVWGIRGQGG